jgi:hypothetical protein
MDFQKILKDFKGGLSVLSPKSRLLKEWEAETGQDFAEGKEPPPSEGASLPVENGSAADRFSVMESSSARVLIGALGSLEGYYFPPDLFGGCCPRLAGEEESIVWNAAAEAADSERIHLVWQAVGDKIWYLAVRSSDLATNPNTWCPFAALLPGQKDARPVPACYTYYTDEAATMMTVTEDSLQIHRGTSAVLRVKAERTVRELGDNVPVVDLTPDVIEALTPVPWYSISLFEDRARRILASLSVAAAVGITVIAFFVWLVASLSIISAHSNLEEIKQRTHDKSTQLLITAQNLRSSTLREQISKFTTLNEGLLRLNGYLEFYQITGNGKILWRAIVPENITSGRITEIGGQTFDTNEKGVIIGNSREVLTMGKGGK